ncbi:hypothetical protein [Pseudomonas sp. RIT288]|jgi:hypothetical protein|uniref:hypothetical protein n=1 Tax=Pseudomonas sp. RIT288 TaxID=1470589 RepID=UPI00044B99F3|nr:hypothetical protein [Pseudomonas sp. RIT288]EZP30946.1 hypothetical protein BW33_03004 [Pseudomonas sp. RIT288]
MNIDISATAAPHGWIVSLDDWQVSFDHLEDARAFVTRLKARIEAPHPWPRASERQGAGQPAREADAVAG